MVVKYYLPASIVALACKKYNSLYVIVPNPSRNQVVFISRSSPAHRSAGLLLLIAQWVFYC